MDELVIMGVERVLRIYPNACYLTDYLQALLLSLQDYVSTIGIVTDSRSLIMSKRIPCISSLPLVSFIARCHGEATHLK